MFDKEFENTYVFNTRILKGKAIIEKWYTDPTRIAKFEQLLGDYNMAVLGSISDDVLSKCGLDTPAQVIELINKYSTKPIVFKPSDKQLKNKAITLLKKWNPDNYDDFVEQLSDADLITLASVDTDIISRYGLNTIMDIKTCIKVSESGKNGVVDFYNGNYNEFLYNTFISHRKIRDNKIDTDISVDNFDSVFFGELMENSVSIYLKYHNKR